MGSAEPVFEETAILLVDANAVKVGERVSLQLWDSDKFTADDMVGHVEVAVAGNPSLLHLSFISKASTRVNPEPQYTCQKEGLIEATD